MRDIVPIICLSIDKFCSGKYIAENHKLSCHGNIPSLYNLLKLGKSLGACLSLPARCKYRYISSKRSCVIIDANYGL